MQFFISDAMAAESGAAAAGTGIDLFIIVIFALVFYFIIWRPQSKRTKEHRELVTSLGKGDEVVTSGGVIGKVARVEEDYLVLEVADRVQIKMQKGAIAAALPKGTIKSI